MGQHKRYDMNICKYLAATQYSSNISSVARISCHHIFSKCRAEDPCVMYGTNRHPLIPCTTLHRITGSSCVEIELEQSVACLLFHVVIQLVRNKGPRLQSIQATTVYVYIRYLPIELQLTCNPQLREIDTYACRINSVTVDYSNTLRKIYRHALINCPTSGDMFCTLLARDQYETVI